MGNLCLQHIDWREQALRRFERNGDISPIEDGPHVVLYGRRSCLPTSSFLNRYPALIDSTTLTPKTYASCSVVSHPNFGCGCAQFTSMITIVAHAFFGYVNRGRREIALCALPPRLSLRRALVKGQTPAQFWSQARSYRHLHCEQRRRPA